MNNLNEIIIASGTPYPLGASKQLIGWNFAICVKGITSLTFCLFNSNNFSPIARFKLDPERNRTGDVWHLFIDKLPGQLCYAYLATYPEEQHLPPKLLSDPYAQVIHNTHTWGEEKIQPYPLALVPIPHPFNLETVVQDDKLMQDFDLESLLKDCVNLSSSPAVSKFNWEDDKAPRTAMKDSIIYEMHVRGFTQDPSSHVKHRGTYLGIIEKIPHLLNLGVTAVELLPVHEFNECEYAKRTPLGDRLYNYWGYSTVNVFSPMQRYASSGDPFAADIEFKTMVKALHKEGIEVILDVVFNHTAEGSILGPTFSYRGLDPHAYYMINSQGTYLDFSGCGNTFSCNHPIGLELILQSLRFWVVERHIDGFRFDLATIFLRDPEGRPMNPSPLLNAITLDPILAETKLIAEPWDAGGLYKVGSFAPPRSRWAEWNGSYRDDIRSFIRGDPHAKNLFATRICGSQDIYAAHATPCASINFVTCHDGFSLMDLVSYNDKHNFDNVEGNRDGTNDNRSWNCGAEGQTKDQNILAMRQRQIRNFHVALMISQGVPLVLMGDEYGHTKNGNNNAWCQDNEFNWFSWDQLEEKKSFYRFYKELIHLRKDHPQLRKGAFLTHQDIRWHGLDGNAPQWDRDDKFVAFTMIDPLDQNDLYIAFNAAPNEILNTLPNPPQGKRWYWIVATHNAPPEDFFAEADSPQAPTAITMLPYSAVILKALKK
jgi:isoamylase